MNRLVVFDCDGTLVDSAATIVRAMEAAFIDAGLAAPDPLMTRRVVGLSLVEAMRAMLPEAETEFHHDLAERYKRAFHGFRGAGTVEEPLYPGMAELIDRLDAEGWLLGVATGKSDRGLAHCLESHGLKHRFVTLQTADRHPSKPHPAMLEAAIAEAGAAPATTLMIGDTSYDMVLATNAGARAIGVNWGYHDAGDLMAAGAERVLTSAAELLTCLERA